MISQLFIIIFIITLISFAVSVPLNGYITSWLITHVIYDKYHAHDEQIENFFGYFDFIGSFCFFFLGLGWGTILPIEQEYITGRLKTLRIFLAYSAQSLVSIFLAISCIIPSVFLTGKGCIYTALHMFFRNSLQTATADNARYIFQQASKTFSDCSPYAITGTLFFIGIVYVQTSILCISMVRNTFQAMLYPFRYQIMMSRYSWLLMLAIPLAFCMIFYKLFFALAFSVILSSIEIISWIIKGA